jgi:hypothetical protein
MYNSNPGRVVQDQLRVGEDAGIEETWVRPAEEVLILAEQGGSGLETEPAGTTAQRASQPCTTPRQTTEILLDV